MSISEFSQLAILSVSPKMVPFSFGDEAFSVGQSPSLKCSVSEGDLPLRLSWLFNGEPISPDRSDISTAMFGKRATILSIDSVSGSHAGFYTCRASNVAGEAEFSTELVVNGSSF